MGKTHAMWRAGEVATGEWILFTDADVFFKPDTLRRAMAYVESSKAQHLVLLPRMTMELPGERMMIEPGVEHSATVGSDGVRCAEAHVA